MAANEAQVQSSQQLTDLSEYQFSGNDFTVERKCALIRALREHGSIYHAAQHSGCSRRAVYDWIAADEEFAQAVNDVREDNYDDLESSVFKRAFQSDLLAMFYLKAHRPKFRDKVTVDVSEVQQQIDQMITRLNTAQRLQLQTAATEFIDTEYSMVSQQYASVSESRSVSEHFVNQHENQQKEQSSVPRETLD